MSAPSSATTDHGRKHLIDVQSCGLAAANVEGSPHDVSHDRDLARRWWATIEIKVPEHEESSFLTIQDDTLSQDDTPSMAF